MKTHSFIYTVLCTSLLGIGSAHADWVWNSGTKTLTDGNWVLKGTVSGTNISVTGKNSVANPASLDLSQPVTDGATTSYAIVSVNGFENTAGLVTLVLPDALKTLGNTAFRTCTSLKTVTPLLPSGLTEIGMRCFAGCTSLEGTVVFPANTITVNTGWASGKNGFFNGSKITSCDMSAATMTLIPSSSFESCANLEWVKLPQGLTSIDGSAFFSCYALTEVTPFLPSTVNNVGAAAFYNCTNLVGDLVIEGVNPITFQHHNNNGYGIFQKTKITSAKITAPTTQFSGRQFAECKQLEWVILPDELESMIWGGDFSGCTSLTNVTPFLPANLKILGGSTFDGCTSFAQPLILDGEIDVEIRSGRTFRNTLIPEVIITAPVTKIGNGYNGNGNVFENMKRLHSVTLPETLTMIERNVFYGDTTLSNLTFLGKCPEVLYPNAFSLISDYQLRLFTPRYETSWETFMATNTTVAPLTAADETKYRQKYPTGMLPAAVWTPDGTSRRIWLFDKTYDGDNAFYVRGTPYNCEGTFPASPSCTILQSGESITCTAPESAIYEGTLYACKGSVLETEIANNVWANPVTNAGLTRVVQQTGSETQRLTWLWRLAGYLVTSTPYGGGSGSVQASPASETGIYLEGTQVTLTATPAPGSRFIRWIGDVTEEQATNPIVTFTVNSDVTCRPLFGNGWTYDASAKTITDGNWVLNTTLSGTELSIQSVQSVISPEVLDIATPVTGNGNTYSIVFIKGFNERPTLTHLFLPDDLRTIDVAAFRQCTGLKMVSPLLPSGLTSIGKRSFAGCTSLEGDVVFPANTIAVNTAWDSGINGFFNGSKITSCDMSAATMTLIPNNSFYFCKNLKWVKLPQGITSIEGDAFSYSYALTEVTPFLPSTINYLGAAAFYDCTNLVGDLVLEGVDPITFQHHNNNGFGIFEKTKIRSATITAPATQFSGRQFSTCKDLEWAILPEGFERFNWGSDFASCSSLTNVYFLGGYPENLTTAFTGLTDYQTRLYIPRDNDTWAPFQEASVSPMDATLTARYRDRYPDGPLPKGSVTISSSNHLWYMLWTTPNSQLNTTVILMR